MIKAIIVDDELLTRRGLVDYIEWEKLGVRITGEASDGLEALELVERTQPQLVLCDIRMPKMNGIDFARKLKEIYPQIKVIFLSGYSDVEYLKSAIQLKAVDYVEKPVNTEELEKLIKKTVLLFHEEEQKAYSERELKNKFEQSIPYLKQKLLKDLTSEKGFSKSNVAERLKQIESGFSLQGNFVCTVLNASINGQLKDVSDVFSTAAKNYQLTFLDGEIDQNYIAIISAKDETVMQSIKLCWEEVVQSISNQFKIVTAVGIGGISNDITRIANSYYQAEEALRHQFFFGSNVVIRYSDIKKASTPRLIFDKQQFLLFEELLKKNELSQAIELINSIVNDLRINNLVSIEQVRKQLFKLYLIISIAFPESALHFEKDILWAKVFMVGELEKIRNFSVNYLLSIQEEIKTIGNKTEKSIIKDVESYIQNNYNRDISINSIAKEAFLAPTYLCLLFKKEKGITINDYITLVRIENAKKLLKDRSLKLYEIANKVGYSDSNYFAKVFRKLSGLTPSDYRDSI